MTASAEPTILPRGVEQARHWIDEIATELGHDELIRGAFCVIRWHNPVVRYAFSMVTDEYPPFRLRP